MKLTNAPEPIRHMPRRWPIRPRFEAVRLDVLSRAQHDFLVPLPRPDLALDVQTLRMIEKP